MSHPNQPLGSVASLVCLPSFLLVLALGSGAQGAVVSYAGYGLFWDDGKSGIVAYPGEGGGTVDTWIPGGHKLTFEGYGDTVKADPLTHVHLGSFKLNGGSMPGNFDGMEFELRVSQGTLYRQPVLTGRISGAVSGTGAHWSTLLVEFERPDFVLDGVHYVLQDASMAIPAAAGPFSEVPIFATISVPEPGALVLVGAAAAGTFRRVIRPRRR